MYRQIVVAFSLPFSVLFAFVLFDYFGISANLMSLVWLAIAIGLMADGSIVMVEKGTAVRFVLSAETGREDNFKKEFEDILRGLRFRN